MKLTPYNPEVHGKLPTTKLTPYNPSVHGTLPDPNRPTAQSLEAEGRNPAFAGVPTDSGGLTPKQMQQAQAASVGKEPSKPQQMTEYGNDPLGRALRVGSRMIQPISPAEKVKRDEENEYAKDLVLAPIKGISNAVGRTIQSGAMASDFVTGGNSAKGVEDYWTWFDKEKEGRALPNFVQEMSEWLPGLIAGGSAANKIIPAATKAWTSMVRALLVGGSADVTASMTTADPDTQRLIVGKDSLVPMLKGFGEDSNGNFSQELAEKKLNLAVDSLLSGGAISGVVGGAAFLTKLFGRVLLMPIVEKVLPEAQSIDVVQQVLKVVGDIDFNKDPKDVIDAKLRKAMDLIGDNKEGVMLLQDADRRLQDEGFINDVLTATIKGTDPTTDAGKAKLVELRAARDSLDTSKMPKLKARLEEPQRAVDSALDQVGKLGDTNVADEVIGNRAVAENITPVKESLEQTIARKEAISEDIQRRLINDPTMGPLLKRVGVNLDSNQISREKAQEITGRLISIGEALNTKKNKLFEAIPDGIIGDMDSVNAQIKVIKDKALDAKFLSNDVIKAIEETGGDIKKLQEIANFNISDKIATLRASGENNAAKALEKLKTIMTKGQLDYVLEKSKLKGNDELIEAGKAVEAATNFYNTEMKPWRENPVLDEILSTYQSRTVVKDIASRQKTREAFEEGVANVSKQTEYMVGSPFQDDLVSVYTRHFGKEAPQQVEDYALLKMSEKIQSDINKTGVITPEQALGYQKLYENISPLLGEKNKKYLEKMFTSIREGVTETADIDQVIKSLTTELKDKEDYVFNYLLKDLRDPKGKPYINSLEGFNGLFNKGSNQNKVKEIMELIADDPLAVDGFKSAYAKNLKSKLFASGKDAAGAKSINIKNINEFLTEGSSIDNYNRMVLGDELTDMLRVGVEQIYSNKGTVKSMPSAVVNVKRIDSAAYQAYTSIITILFGVLNPTAARIRAVSSRINANIPIADAVEKMTDTLVSNPDEFIKIADMLIQEGVVSEEIKKRIKQAALRAGTYRMSDNASLEEQTNEVFNER